MPKIIFILGPLLIGLSMANASIKKVCDNSPGKRLTQLEANAKLVAAEAKKVTSDKAKIMFQETDDYHWGIFASPESLAKTAEPKDKDYCVKHYRAFVEEKDEKKALNKRELWRACLNANYRDNIPPMAKDLLKCHGAKDTEDSLDGDGTEKEE